MNITPISASRCGAFEFSKICNVFDKDLVITIDYTAYYEQADGNTLGGFVVGFLPYYRILLDGYSTAYGLGYASVSSLGLSGIEYVQLGVGFDFAGTFSLSGDVGTGGLSSINPNSICLRGSAPDYEFITATNNLTTYPTSFKLFDIGTPSTSERSARIRITDLGNTVIVDLKDSPTSNYVNYLNTQLNYRLPPYCRFYVGYSGPSDLTFKIRNINVNGYDATMTYLISSADYIGLSAEGIVSYPITGLTLSTGDTIQFQNDSGLVDTLIIQTLSTYTIGMPYVAGDQYILIDYHID